MQFGHNPVTLARNISGETAARTIANGREFVADLIGASSHEITFTSGATEANNLAVIGAVRAARNQDPSRNRIFCPDRKPLGPRVNVRAKSTKCFIADFQVLFNAALALESDDIVVEMPVQPRGGPSSSDKRFRRRVVRRAQLVEMPVGGCEFYGIDFSAGVMPLRNEPEQIHENPFLGNAEIQLFVDIVQDIKDVACPGGKFQDRIGVVGSKPGDQPLQVGRFDISIGPMRQNRKAVGEII
ncbi:aminotransferase class V-fold PLP-dependent enzyme [Phyllobacterium salinisoli]|uniref:Aminotransferase class V-fold PLP-dependent enzyme n=1 Tax=Phyllobacterium salinisoli TaxID=1899321 RepID=A0A368JZM9_9HYPH|nr:aminotransferase class V-fold PLP-dependent enzyme [Phyllobacterium salinisoli]